MISKEQYDVLINVVDQINKDILKYENFMKIEYKLMYISFRNIDKNSVTEKTEETIKKLMNKNEFEIEFINYKKWLIYRSIILNESIYKFNNFIEFNISIKLTFDDTNRIMKLIESYEHQVIQKEINTKNKIFIMVSTVSLILAALFSFINIFI